MSPVDHPSPAALLRRFGLRPRRSMGQCFLSDSRIAERIAEATGVGPGDRVVEVGAGLGALTVHLLAKGALVIAIERDPKLVRALTELLGDSDALEILEADAIGLDYSSLAPGAAVAGNLPYYASAPILFGLLEHTGGTGPWILMLQREVADRIRSEPGTKGYGTLTALLAPHRVVSLVSNVGPGAFHPAPKVSSAVLRFDPRPAPLFPDVDGEAYRRVVKAAFGTRRKTLRNSLRAAGFDDPEATLAAAGIDPGRRGETLAPAELADIARVLQRRLVGGSG